ncbi:CHASE sensor domain-containing protein [Methylobacillus glycogenes]|uniref:CHASE sensor domain-containing protein n=1 Tax=Methylobacillus glycogenes TaxID=406 RepID=UPI000470EE9F|nr:CHASE sensor domain-containing protein [Methylobacillus glycogenes]
MSDKQAAPTMLRMAHILAVGLALLIATFSLVGMEYASLRNSMTNNMQVQMRIMAHNIAQSLVAGEREVATEVLSSLAASPEIDAAVLYGAQQNIFAEYKRKGSLPQALQMRGLMQHQQGTDLHKSEVWQPVMYEACR